MIYDILGAIFLILFAVSGIIALRGRKNGFGPAAGLCFFFFNMALFCFTAPFLQGNFGLWGLMATELLILLTVVLLPKSLTGKPLFSLRFPAIRHSVGGILLWLGAIWAASLGTSLMQEFFPETIEDIAAVNTFLSEGNLALIIAASVIAPAVCEEMLHRGVVLGSLRGRFNTPTIVILGGLIFGLFHLDPARFLQASVLGMALTYAGLRAGTVLLPILMHLINNLFALLSWSLIRSSDLTAETVPESDPLANMLYSAAVGLIFLAIGYRLLRDPAKKPRFSPLIPIAAFMLAALLIMAAKTMIF